MSEREERGFGNFEKEDGEGGEGGWGVVVREESVGEGGFSGAAEVREFFEDGHLVDEFVDMGNVEDGGEADTGIDDVVACRNQVLRDDGRGRRRGRWRCSCGHFC